MKSELKWSMKLLCKVHMKKKKRKTRGLQFINEQYILCCESINKLDCRLRVNHVDEHLNYYNS